MKRFYRQIATFGLAAGCYAQTPPPPPPAAPPAPEVRFSDKKLKLELGMEEM